MHDLKIAVVIQAALLFIDFEAGLKERIHFAWALALDRASPSPPTGDLVSLVLARHGLVRVPSLPCNFFFDHDGTRL